MLRRQCGNQLRAERARETTKLIAIIDDDDTMQDSLRDREPKDGDGVWPTCGECWNLRNEDVRREYIARKK
jgi:hypothetical protein